jgi:nucleoside phosphorylase
MYGDEDTDEGQYWLSVVQVAQSDIFNRHYSGYTQAAALAALVAKVWRPDLVISFGTSGGHPTLLF